jgi:Cu(I)/Ag(I) efflux system membrane fusion protein
MYANVNRSDGERNWRPDEAVLDSVSENRLLDKGEGPLAPAEVKIGANTTTITKCSPGCRRRKILASASFLLDSESRLNEAMGAMAGMAGHGDMKGMETKAPPKAGPQEKKVRDLTLTLATQPEKPKAGDNVMRLKITDKSGQIVKNAQVSFVFNMTMPGWCHPKEKES